MPGPAAGLVPIAFAAGVVRMAAPTVARELIKRGIVKKASQAAVRKAGDNISKVTRTQAENLAKKRAGRTPPKKPNTSTSPTSAPKPKNTGVGQQKPRPTGNRGAGRKPPKEKTPNTSTSPTSAPKPKNTGVGQQKPRPTGNRGAGRKQPSKKPEPPKQPVTPKTPKKPDKPKNIVKPVVTGTGTAAGVVGGLASLDNKKKKKRKVVGSGQTPATGYVESKKPKPKPNVDLADDTYIKDSKPTKAKKSKKADDGYRYYGKKGTGLGDFSRKYGMKYATQEQFEKDFDMSGGAKKGGSIKKLAKKRRKGFSGRGVGKALRGF